MFNIKTLNKISSVGLAEFDKSKYAYGDDIANPDAIMVRSAAMHDMEMPKPLLAIARAGAGVNNIPIDRCTQDGIVVSTPPVQMQMRLRSLLYARFCFQAEKSPRQSNGAKRLKTMKMSAKR